MMTHMNDGLCYYCCCLLLLLFHGFATIDVCAFHNNAATSISIRQTASNGISARPTTSSSAMFTANSTNVWFDIVEDFLPFSDKGANKNMNSKRDVMERLEAAEVGQDLLDEVTMFEDETAIVELPVMFAGEMDSSFDFERWELHRSPQRYGRLLLGLFSGVTTRRIAPTVVFLVVWSALIQFYNSFENLYGLPELELPLTPFELAAPVLGLLLVFRSNTAFERFNVGSDASWEITGRFRSVIRQLLSFSANAERFSAKERAAAYDLVDACMVLHAWILDDYLRSPNSNRNAAKSSAKQSKILQKALQFSVVSYDDMEFFDDDSSESATAPRRQRLQQTPSGLINTVTMGVFSRMPSLDPQEAVMIEEQFAQVISSLGICEKLIRTPIPLGYTRYAVRFTMIWLTLLPLALVRAFDGFSTDTWWAGKPEPNLTISMLFLSVVFLSIEDISVQLEEPFSVLPLDLHSKWLKKDFVQMKRTSKLVDGLATDMGQRPQYQEESIPKKKNNKRSRFRKLIRQEQETV